MSYVEFSRRDGVKILRKTLHSLGYTQDVEALAIWSALWIEDRCDRWELYDGGVTKLLTHMIMAKGTQYKDLMPRMHNDYVVGGKCPFMLARFIISMEKNLLQKKVVVFGGPIVPILMMPLLIEHFDMHGFHIDLEFRTGTFQGSHSGIKTITSEGDWIGLYGLPNFDDDEPVRLTLKSKPKLQKKSKIQKAKFITLPEARLRGKGPLYL